MFTKPKDDATATLEEKPAGEFQPEVKTIEDRAEEARATGNAGAFEIYGIDGMSDEDALRGLLTDYNDPTAPAPEADAETAEAEEATDQEATDQELPQEGSAQYWQQKYDEIAQRQQEIAQYENLLAYVSRPEVMQVIQQSMLGQIPVQGQPPQTQFAPGAQTGNAPAGAAAPSTGQGASAADSAQGGIETLLTLSPQDLQPPAMPDDYDPLEAAADKRSKSARFQAEYNAWQNNVGKALGAVVQQQQEALLQQQAAAQQERLMQEQAYQVSIQRGWPIDKAYAYLQSVSNPQARQELENALAQTWEQRFWAQNAGAAPAPTPAQQQAPQPQLTKRQPRPQGTAQTSALRVPRTAAATGSVSTAPTSNPNVISFGRR